MSAINLDRLARLGHEAMRQEFARQQDEAVETLESWEQADEQDREVMRAGVLAIAQALQAEVTR